MSITAMTFDVEEELKCTFESIADELGIGASDVLNAMVRAFVRSKGGPFQMTLEKSPEDVEEERFYSTANMAFIDESTAAAKRGEVLSFDSIEELHRCADTYSGKIAKCG